MSCTRVDGEVLRLHFNFRIGADDREVAEECKFGPCACTSISGLVPTIPKLLRNVSSGLVLTLQFQIVFSGPEVLEGCKFAPCAYTSVTRCLMSLTWAIKQKALGRVRAPT